MVIAERKTNVPKNIFLFLKLFLVENNNNKNNAHITTPETASIKRGASKILSYKIS